MSSSIKVISDNLIERDQIALAEQQTALRTATDLWAEATVRFKIYRFEGAAHLNYSHPARGANAPPGTG